MLSIFYIKLLICVTNTGGANTVYPQLRMTIAERKKNSEREGQLMKESDDDDGALVMVTLSPGIAGDGKFLIKRPLVLTNGPPVPLF
jgi:hypothetical protein